VKGREKKRGIKEKGPGKGNQHNRHTKKLGGPGGEGRKKSREGTKKKRGKIQN